MSTKSTSSSHL